jgi:hypothetical protein
MSDMTCDEFRSQIADAKHSLDVPAAEHAATCAECRAIAHAQEELGRFLAMVREGAPGVPALLDAAVTAAYRERTRHKASDRRTWVRSLAWSALAAGLILGAVLLVSHQKTDKPVVPIAVKAGTTSAREAPATSVRTGESPSQPVVTRRYARAHRPRSKQEPAAVAEGSAPNNGFQSLMYCDALSCAGDMQVIRIQVPAAAVDQVPAWHPSNGMVQADVVVGSDGIARAIRIVR